jgi:hypothetical protein
MTGYEEPTEQEQSDMTAAFLWSRLPAETRRKVQNHLIFEEQDVVQQGVRNGRKLIRDRNNRRSK